MEHASPLASGVAALSRAVSDIAPRGSAAWPAAAAAATAPPSPQAGQPRRSNHQLLPPRQRVQLAVAANQQEYLQGLGLLAPPARPSSLQQLLKRRRCTPSSLCAPQLDATALHFADFHVSKGGQLAPVNGPAQCHLSLGTVHGLPAAGVRERRCWLNVARLCLFDGARFHGNVQAVKPSKVKTAKDGSMVWRFDPAPLLVRCPQHLLASMQVYIEFCVSYELLPEEAQRLPARPESAARLCDELCLAWALVDLRTLQTLHTRRKLSLPLRGGPLSQRMLLQQCYSKAAAATQDAAQRQQLLRQCPSRKGVFGHSEQPCLSVRLAPVPPAETPAAALLPAAAVASPPLAQVVGLYRLLLADALPTPEEAGPAQPASSCILADHVLAFFPQVLDDPELSRTFFSLWQQHTEPRMQPSTAELKRGLRQCTTLVWAMMGAQAVPAATIANCCAHQWERSTRMEQYQRLHPVTGLSSAAHDWLHRPFCASEVVVTSLPAAAAAVSV